MACVRKTVTVVDVLAYAGVHCIPDDAALWSDMTWYSAQTIDIRYGSVIYVGVAGDSRPPLASGRAAAVPRRRFRWARSASERRQRRLMPSCSSSTRASASTWWSTSATAPAICGCSEDRVRTATDTLIRPTERPANLEQVGGKL